MTNSETPGWLTFDECLLAAYAVHVKEWLDAHGSDPLPSGATAHASQ